MSWADVAKSSPRNTKSTQTVARLLVRYSYDPPPISNESTQLDVPQDRERTPHPADDFIMTNGSDKTLNTNENNNKSFVDYWPQWKNEWIDYAKDRHLRQFKHTLPLNIQRIIEFAANIRRNGKGINLNFNEIDADLKKEYLKYHGDQEILKKYISIIILMINMIIHSIIERLQIMIRDMQCFLMAH